MKSRKWKKKETKAASPFLCPHCGGTGVDDMGYSFSWRCDRCHRWYTEG